MKLNTVTAKITKVFNYSYWSIGIANLQIRKYRLFFLKNIFKLLLAFGLNHSSRPNPSLPVFRNKA